MDGLLFIAEQHIDQADLSALVKKVSDCIWRNEPLNEKYSKALYIGKRLRLMRLAQAMRAWRQITVFGTQQGNEAIITWVNKLTTLWDSEPETWHERFKWLMDSQHPFAATSKHGEYNWLDWLKKPQNNDAIQHLGLTPLHKWPKPLAWNDKEKNRLSQIFKQSNEADESSLWVDWVNELSSCMNAAVRARNTKPHFAWQEENALDKLSDHLTVVADQQFTAKNGLALAALIWRTYRENWVTRINKRINELHELEIGEEEHYMDIRNIYHWSDEQSVKVTLNIRFRGTRSLLIEHAQYNDKHIIRSSARMFPIKANNDYHAYEFTLTTVQGELDAHIELICHDFRGIQFTRSVHLKDQRGLLGFRRAEVGWQAQAEKLMHWLDSGRPFYWLCGPDWPQQEHERLIAIVRDNYSAALNNVRFINTLTEVLTQDLALFVPGFTSEPEEIVLSLHALLHQQHKEGLNPLALAIWLWARSPAKNNDVPENNWFIWETLQEQIPDYEAVTNLLNKLFSPKEQQALQTGIRAYPASNVINWSCGGILQEQPYRPWLGELGINAWINLLASGMSIDELAAWFSVNAADIEQLQHYISVITQTNNTKAIIQPLIQALLANNITVNHADGIPVVIRSIDTMHRTWQYIYIVPKGTHIDRKVQSQSAGLWLLLEHEVIFKLPGTVISLKQDQILSLLTTGSPEASQQCLNRIAGTQLPLNPHDVFQDKNGLNENIIMRSFSGRKRELATLEHTVQQGGGSVLTVGTRRAGKTSLINRLLVNLKQNEASAPWVKITGLDMPGHADSEKEASFLRWFLNKIRCQLEEQDQHIRYDWKDSANTKQREEALIKFKQRLTDISDAQGALVLLLDETLALLKADINNHYQVGHLLRSWIDDNLVSVIATAYPHGSDNHPSLYHHMHTRTSDNPWYNFFAQGVIKLEPWSPQETWEFLAPRLAGFGLILPPQFAQSLLGLTRGIPWIAQHIGIALCDRSKRRSNQITKGDWDNAVKQTRQEVSRQLKDDVRAAVNELDAQFTSKHTPNPFNEANLWNVLTEEAARAKLVSISINATQWPEANALDLQRMQRNLGDAVLEETLQTALVVLSEAGLLEGEDNNQRFIFWNDLFPAFVKER